MNIMRWPIGSDQSRARKQAGGLALIIMTFLPFTARSLTVAALKHMACVRDVLP